LKSFSQRNDELDGVSRLVTADGPIKNIGNSIKMEEGTFESHLGVGDVFGFPANIHHYNLPINKNKLSDSLSSKI